MVQYRMKNFVYVGIGASAGGLQALQKLVATLPKTLNYVYIIAQHLDPNKKSTLSEILARASDLNVQELTKSTKFQANHIYIIPTGYNLVCTKHHLELKKNTASQHLPTPSVDKLFEALALCKKQDSVGIVLTGSGKDGTKGVETIKKYSGITIAQAPKEAGCKSMPNSAINSNNVDYILTLDEISEGLSNSLYTKLPPQFKEIQHLLHEEKKLPIEKYKNETILRRINKRMLLLNIQTLEEYQTYLRNRPQELDILHQNILIGVTQFFRDKEAFKALEEQLYLYLKDTTENYDLRIWSIACSTGEEAYSLAILIDKISQKLHKTFNLQIFATDIDEIALNKARSAIYSKTSVENIDKKTLRTYFTPIDGSYKIIEKIRKQIIFTRHNILNEPPFINQDIISCRNLLIYLLPETQQEIFTLLHYTLKENGILFLGSSESTLVSPRYFTALDSQYKIYFKEKLDNPPKISSHYFKKHLENKHAVTQSAINQKDDFNLEHSLKEATFNFFAPNTIVIDTNYNIIYKKGELPFLKIPDGFITLNILDNIHKSLRYDLNRVIKQALHQQSLQVTKFIEILLNDDDKVFIKIIVTPLHRNDKNPLLFLYFQQLHANDLQFNTNALNLPDESLMIKSLTTQLAEIQEDYHKLSDELFLSKENMQLMNEELQSSNEELQSSNEELETSNEELQSSNEELHASILNEQILQKQLSQILNASQDGIVGLDIHGNHTFVNNAALKILGFTKDELIGHNAHTLWHHSKEDGSIYPFQKCTLHNHLLDKKSIRTQDLFWKKDGTAIHVEVLQNPIIENRVVTGAVLSFHDITEKIKLAKLVEHEHKLAELYINIVGTLIMTLDLDGNITLINKEGASLLGLSVDATIGRNWFNNFLPADTVDEVKKVFDSIVSGKKSIILHHTNKIIDIHKQEHLIAWTNSYTKDTQGKITGLITSGIDISKEEALSKKLFEQEHLYKLTFEEADIGIAHATLEGKWLDTNEYMTQLLGYTKNEFQQMTVEQITYKDDLGSENKMLQELLKQEKESYHIEKRYIHKNGSIVWVSLSVVLLKDEEEKPLYFLKIVRDISQLKLLMYQLESEKNRFKKIIDFTPTPLILYTEDEEIILVNKTFEENTGYMQQELPDIATMIKKLFKDKNHKELLQIKKYYKNPVRKTEEQQEIVTKFDEKRVGILHAVALDVQENISKKMYLIAIIDITDLQKKDEFMIAQSRQAAMGDMLAMVAHQWRQPLSIISMLANNIRLQKELGNEVSEDDINHLITGLNKQTAYLSHTIDDFRDFFKPDKMKETVSLNSILQKTMTLVGKSLKNNNIKLTHELQEEIILTTYPNQLMQILINLINNAKDAIKDNNINDGLIQISATQKKKNLIINICDNGGGIDKSVLDKLGQPYVTTKSKNGTGLGLYMSIIITSKHLGGKLHWENKEKGSCFYITLPNS